MADKKTLVNIDFGGSSSIKGLPSVTAASGDYIVITDASDDGKAKKGPSFATNDGKFLRHDGTWVIPAGIVTSVDSVAPTSGNVALSAVRYVSQSLTDAQKTQARANIGAGTSNLTLGNTASTAAAGNHNHDGTYLPLSGGGTISANATPIVTFKKSASSSGSFIGFKPNNQDNSVWLTGVTSALAYRFSYSTNGGTTVTKKMELDTDGNLEVAGSISEAGTALSSKYLGISSTAADSTKLNGQAASYYLNYSNLSNKPTIPAAQVNSDWNASSGVAKILNKPTLATVATSGSYNDLSNKPTIPSVSNATITVKQTGRNDQTFTLNGSATTINLDNTTYSEATASASGLMSSADKAKVDSLGTAAYVNTGSSSGNVPLLDSSGKLPTGILPALAVTDTFTAASQAAMLALSAQKGDICIRTDENKTYVLSAEPASTLANWKQLLTPTDANSYHSTGSWSGLTYTAANNGGAPNLAFTIPTGTSASTVCVGNDSRLSDARPASDVSAWAKAASKPSYTASEVGALASSTKYAKSLSVSGKTVTLKDQDGTVLSTITTQDTTYSAATQSDAGLMSATDKTKLDGIATGATKVIESTVSGWGFTKNAGTVTSVDSVSPTNGDVSLSAVRYVSQSLTAAQKTQARSNIGAGISNLTLGITASTAAAGNHDHDGQYLSTQGGELMSSNVPILTLYNKNTPNGSTFLDFKYNGQDAKQWRAGVEGSDDYFYILYTPNGSSGFLKKVWATPTGEWWTDSDIYEAGTKLSAKYYAASNPNGYTSNTGTVIGSGLTANNIILGNGGVNIKASSYTVATSSTTWSDSDDTKLPTMKAISNKIASSGGTTKYTHHITASWSNGSGANYRGGTISFQFEDTTSSSYSQNNVSSNTLVSFILTHCGISVSSGEKSYPVNATLQYRDDSSKDCYIASKITNSYSSIYIVGYVVTSNSFYYESGGSYLWNYLPDGVSVIKIEDIVH